MGEKVRDGVREIVPAGQPDAAEERELDIDGKPRLILPSAADLGPNGSEVLTILSRAARLTPAEGRAMEHEADWRWWSLTPAVGTTIAAARPRAVVVGRNAGRGDAIATFEAAVHRVMAARTPGRKESGRLVACVAAAGLAVLVRDLIDGETFEQLSGPWHAVTHA